MTMTLPALTSLLTAATALTLVANRARKWLSTLDVIAPAPTSAATPMPKATTIPAASPRRRKANLPDTTCEGCGTPIPGNETLCPLCARKQAAAKGAGWTTLWHWLFTIAVLTVLYGGAYLLTP
ncbi:hypothetical protein NHN26_03585 [Rhodovulum tesquicola]|uniref:hypothetical protein n=1 Tax=Rhodovulum tesquicola TaxID=540254 RepID=UPI0020976F86|nr:hypothetical protein [Rhodovulum tesquicola]MCO8144302.1 hypothetical protein [Rhodovulum tesquicola]